MVYITQCISLGFENKRIYYFCHDYFGLTKSQLIGKHPDLGEGLKAKGKEGDRGRDG